MATIPLGEGFGDTLKEQLECPVCTNLCTTPIFMCFNGHNVCSSCQPQLEKCPVCRVAGRLSIRNRFAETLAQSAKVPCPNADQGCKDSVKVQAMVSHLEQCKFNFKCQFESCRWRGSVVDLDDHARSVHPENYTIVNENGVVLKISDVDGQAKNRQLNESLHTLSLSDSVECGTDNAGSSLFSTSMLVFQNHIFWFHTEVVGKTSFNVQLHLIGSMRDSFSLPIFSYELEFLSGEGARLSYKNNVRSLKSDAYCDKVFDGALALLSNGLASGMIYRLKLFAGAFSKDRLSTDYVRTNVFQLRTGKPEHWIRNLSTS